MGQKRKTMEDEMSRFEAEISTSANMFIPSQLAKPVIASNTYSTVQQKLQQQPAPIMHPHLQQQHHHHQQQHNSVPPPPQPPPFISSFVSVPVSSGSYSHSELPEKSYSTEPRPVVLSSAPKLYSNRPAVTTASYHQTNTIDISAISFEVTNKLKKLKTDKMTGPNPIAEAAIMAARASSALQSFGHDDKRTKKTKKQTVRIAGGSQWEDPSLADWPDDDFRIFCGDLGNDVNDELLTRTFNKFASFQKAKVIRDKRTGKSKGFGFISFKEPVDFIRAMKEMDGRYVGSRPIKLRKSTWRARSVDIVKKREKERIALQQMFAKS